MRLSRRFSIALVLQLSSLSIICTSAQEARKRQSYELLKFGDKCTVPRQGGEHSLVTQCDASKGLVCNGKACICTFSDYFAYDKYSDECRKKLGKSCRITKDELELKELPFHLKCHTTATCTVVSRKLMLDGEAAGNSKHAINGFTMCICKYGYEPNLNLDGCHAPSPTIVLEPFRQAIGMVKDKSEEDY